MIANLTLPVWCPSGSAIMTITGGLLLTGSDSYNNTVGLLLTGSDGYDNTAGLLLTGSDGLFHILLFYNLF